MRIKSDTKKNFFSVNDLMNHCRKMSYGIGHSLCFIFSNPA